MTDSELTCGDMYAGGGGFTLGAQAAGIRPLWAIERDADIAAVYRPNLGNHIIVGDVLTTDPARLARVAILLASPPCQGASIARSKKLAPHTDAEAGRAVIAYVRALRPRALVLENVPPYEHTATFRAIVRDLAALGYFVHWTVVNAADFGVPQTRRRLILRAMRDGLVPPLPAPVPWRGWYAAIEDLLPTLPESKFASWQIKRLGWLTEATLVEGGNPTGTTLGRSSASPSPTITASAAKHLARAYLVHTQRSQATDEPIIRAADLPASTVTVNSGGRTRAYLAHPTAANDRFVLRVDGEPAFTITNTNGTPRAYLVSSSTDLATRAAGEPAATVTATTHTKAARPRAWLDQGRVVSLTPRALARLQTFPDWYALPDARGLACRVIGNAAPCLLAQRLLEGIAAALDTREERTA